jgi:hypothetical protein
MCFWPAIGKALSAFGNHGAATIAAGGCAARGPYNKPLHGVLVGLQHPVAPTGQMALGTLPPQDLSSVS